MSDNYTTEKQDVLDAIANGITVNPSVIYDDDSGLYHLLITFNRGEENVRFKTRGFHARTKEDAEKKGHAQFVRMKKLK